MQRLETIRIFDAIAEFADHERRGRFHIAQSFATPADAVEFALLRRAPVLARILKAVPIEATRVLIDPSEIDRLRFADGRTPSQWVEWVTVEPKSFAHYDAMAMSPTPIEGPLLLAGQTDASLIVYDGYHRMAAWWTHIQHGRRYPITANLVITRLTPR
jgi:hypothetical protein